MKLRRMLGAGIIGIATALTLSLAPAVSAVPGGPDVSSHQHPGDAPINWSAVRQAGYEVAFVKATESDWYVNPFFYQDSIGLRLNGMIRGSYHYADPTKPAAAQATLYAATVLGQNGPLDLPPVLDIEHSGGLSPAALQGWVREFVGTIRSLSGRDPIIYTYPYFWQTAMANTQEFSNLPLWIADYSGANAPRVPGGWATWTFWQTTSSGRVPGVDTPIDLNLFNGNIDRLRVLGNATGLSGALGSLGSA